MFQVDYYKCLQVDQEAELEMIELAYKKLSQKYHPDKNGTKEAHEKMCLLNEAYQVLRDSESRMRYNRLLKTVKQSKAFHTTSDALKIRESAFVKPLNMSKQIITAYLEAISKKNYVEAYHLIHPMHKASMSLKIFKNWQHWVSKVYQLIEFQIVPSEILNQPIIEDIPFEWSITFEIRVKEYNQIMEHYENDVFYKTIIVDSGGMGLYLDQIEVFEVMKRFEKLAKLKQGNKYRISKTAKHRFTKNQKTFFEVVELELERYTRYATPFSLVFFKLQSGEAHNQFALLEIFKSIMLENIRRLDYVVQYDSDNFIALLPGIGVKEGMRFSEKIVEITESSVKLSEMSFTLKRIVMENEYVVLSEIADEIDRILLES